MEVDDAAPPNRGKDATLGPAPTTPVQAPNPASSTGPAEPPARRTNDHMPLSTLELCTSGSVRPAGPRGGHPGDTPQLVEAQRQDPWLQDLRNALEAGRGEANDFMLANDGLLWHAPRGRTYAIAVPKLSVPAVLALTHGTYGHPGVARTSILIEWKTTGRVPQEGNPHVRTVLQMPPEEASLESAACDDAGPPDPTVGGAGNGHPGHEGGLR